MYCLFCSDICLTFSKTECLFLDELSFFLCQVWSERRAELVLTRTQCSWPEHFTANRKPLPEVHQVTFAVVYRCRCFPSSFLYNFTNTRFFPPSVYLSTDDFWASGLCDMIDLSDLNILLHWHIKFRV